MAFVQVDGEGRSTLPVARLAPSTFRNCSPLWKRWIPCVGFSNLFAALLKPPKNNGGWDGCRIDLPAPRGYQRPGYGATQLLPRGYGVSSPAERFLDDLEGNRAMFATWKPFLTWVRDHPELLPSFVEGGLRRRLSGVPFLGEVVSYLPVSAIGPLAELAVRLHAPAARSRSDLVTRAASEVVLARIALQFPAALHPWLTELFEQEVNFDQFTGTNPWRESGDRHHAYLLNVVRSSGIGERSRRALECLLETRTSAAFRAVERHEDILAYGHVRFPHLAQIDSYLPEVGYERARARPNAAGSGWARSAAAALLARLPGRGEEKWRRLYPAASYHVTFPAGYLPVYASWGHEHPTYHLDADDAVPARLGGTGTATCGVCGRQVHHLLTLDPVPAGLGVTSVPTLVLETCLHCIWDNGDLWWKHDSAGRPAPHQRQGGEDCSTARVPLRETTVRLVPTPMRWYWQDARHEQENLTRVGGYPSWIQSADFPSCPDCGKTMPFLFQLDSGLPGDGDESFGDGILFTYWCNTCRVSISVPQGE